MNFSYRICCLLLLIPFSVAAQNKQGKEHPVGRAAGKIQLDGELLEKAWQDATVGDGFFMCKPYDSVPPLNKTAFRITFDEQFLYVAFECMDDGGAPIVQSLRRDFDFQGNDNIGIYLEPYNDYTNGFYFNITPYNVQREGLIVNGGGVSEDYSSFWDNKWYSFVKRYDGYWVAELAIPLKSIRYNVQEWHFNVLRNDVERNQISSWIATPVQYLPASFIWSGKIAWKDPLPKPGLNISLIPYMAGSVAQDNENNLPSDKTGAVGFDAKIGLTSSLNLDLTVNPDFSQVEVDQQVINLTRFEFGFPERRQFFLENSDLFAQPGFPDSRPFFSRRVGLATDSTDALQKISILYGARLSGKIGKNWRIGVMNLQTQKKKELGLPAQNYSVAVVQRQVFARSNIGFVFINKQSLGLDDAYDPSVYYHKSIIHETINGVDTTRQLNRYNRVFGMDFNLFSKDSRFRGDVYYHRSIDEFSKGKRYSGGGYLAYSTRNLDLAVAQQIMGDDFNAEVGFTPSLSVYPGYYFGFGRAQLKLYVKSKTITQMGPSIETTYTMTPNQTFTDNVVRAQYNILFLNTATLLVEVNRTHQQLTKNFNPISNEYDQFLTGENYAWERVELRYASDLRKRFNVGTITSYGGFYTGESFAVNGFVNYRYQPFGSLSVRFDYNDIRLPDGYGTKKLFLIGPRLDLTFTNTVFLTTFVQYNDRNENVNLNARFQWRFKPASDFFVVYTENYLPNGLRSKNRALVLKLTYWFNL